VRILTAARAPISAAGGPPSSLRRRILAGGTFMAVASFASYAAAVLVFWYGGRLVQGGRMSVGQIASFLIYTVIVAFSLGADRSVGASPLGCARAR
jgi:ABC-type multidrug transport system fused ATPase/permease subunit